MNRAGLAAYYAARAAEYERIYARPERRSDLDRLAKLIPEYFRGRDVLEIACGTGYWTEHIAQAARHVVATDINGETLDIAKTKPVPAGSVTFEIADVYALPPHYAGFTGAFAGFWFSHVLRAERARFVEALHRALEPGAVVAILDNRYVEGSSTPIAETDSERNTYQRRRLDDGSEHVVLKNFPTEAELRADVGARATDVEYVELEYYWLLKYCVSGKW